MYILVFELRIVQLMIYKNNKCIYNYKYKLLTITKMIMTIVDIQFSYYMRNHRFFFLNKLL